MRTASRRHTSSSASFYDGLVAHADPIDLHALKSSPLTLDIYSWLTYRPSYLRNRASSPGKRFRRSASPTTLGYGTSRGTSSASLGRFKDFEGQIRPAP